MLASLLFALARAEDAADPAPETPAAPVPPSVTSATPTLTMLAGTWYVTSTIDGKEVVAWACGSHPDSFDFDDNHVMIGVGNQQYGGVVASSSTTSTTLTLKTTLDACKATKNVTLKWADPAQKVLDITRCTGSPTRVRAVRDLASAVPVMRQCCDPAGKAIKYVTIDEACPAGSTGQKPNPLKR